MTADQAARGLLPDDRAASDRCRRQPCSWPSPPPSPSRWPRPGRPGDRQRQPGRRHLRDQRAGQRRRLPGRHHLPRRQLHLGRRVGPQPAGRPRRRHRQPPCPGTPSANGGRPRPQGPPAGTWVYVGGDFTAAATSSPGRRPQPDQRRRLRLGPVRQQERQGDHHLPPAPPSTWAATSTRPRGRAGSGWPPSPPPVATSPPPSPNVSNGAGNFATVLSLAVRPDNQTLLQRRLRPGQRQPAATRPPCRPASPPRGPGTRRHRRRRRRPHGLGLGEHGVRGGRATGGYVQAYGPTAGGSPV